MLHEGCIDDQGLAPAIASQIDFAQLHSECLPFFSVERFSKVLLFCSSVSLLVPAEHLMQ